MRWFLSPRRELEFTVEELVTLTDYSAEREEWDRALGFVRAAIKMAPTSARLRMDEGYFLQESGRSRAALQSYRKAAELSGDGGPHFHLGILLARLDRLEDAADAFCIAFSRSPALVLDAEGDPDVARVASRPSFRAARRRALARL